MPNGGAVGGTVYVYFTSAYRDLGEIYQVNTGSSVEVKNMAGDLLYSVPDSGQVSGGRKFIIQHDDYTCTNIITEFPSWPTVYHDTESYIAVTCTNTTDTYYQCYSPKFK